MVEGKPLLEGFVETVKGVGRRFLPLEEPVSDRAEVAFDLAAIM